jgi:catalase
LNRHGGPNFEQLPINRPRVPIHNNNRDGAGQNYIPLNTAAYSPNTLNQGSPKQANQTVGNGFFTSPDRTITGQLVRSVSSTFSNVWSQPRLFYNSLLPVEQQFLINAIRFETSHLKSLIVKQNVVIQLNRISNDLAKRVARVIGINEPVPDPTYYNNNSTAFVSIFNKTLPTIKTLKVGILASTSSQDSIAQTASLSAAFTKDGVNTVIVAEILASGVDQTYSAADATGFDAIVVTSGAESLFTNGASSTLFPAGRPAQILTDGYRWGKPVGVLSKASAAVLKAAGITVTPGVYVGDGTDIPGFVASIETGLSIFKFIDRFPVDS